MKRFLAYCAGLALGAAVSAGTALAQDADDREAVARQAPVFDLQPGQQREQPQPDVQGPRAPGVPAPRLLGQEEDGPPATTVPSAPVQTQAQPEPQQSDPQPAAERPAVRSNAETPVAVEDTESAAQEGLAVPVPVPGETDNGAPAETAQASPETAPEPLTTEAMPWWTWLAALLAIAALAVTFWLRRGRAAEPATAQDLTPLVKQKPAKKDPEADREPVEQPVTAEPERPTPLTPQTALAVSAPSKTPAKSAPSRIEIDFVPLAARLSTLGLTLAYRLVLQNVSDETLSDVAVRLAIRCADGAAFETGPEAGEACVSLDTLGPGKTHTHSAEIRLDPKTYKPVQSDGKPMLVPIVDMMPRYRDADGVSHAMHASMLVGRELEPPRPKMQPFWLERGFGHFRGIGCRMLKVSTT